MSVACTRCEGTGFLNLYLCPEALLKVFDHEDDTEVIQNWMSDGGDPDVSVCDCCGDKDGWYGEPGQHYNDADPAGSGGPYEYNGGLCECH